MNYTNISTKMQEDYDAVSHAFSDSRSDLKWPELDQMIEAVQPGSKVLDIGCGTGRLCKQLESKSVNYTGVDLSEGQLKQARKACPDSDFIQAPMNKLPFTDETFDEVFHIATLHHAFSKEERLEALKEAIRVLKPGGRLFLTVMGLWIPRYRMLFFDKDAGLKSLKKEQQEQVRWNDIFIPWKWKVDGEPIHRYYHAFTKRELLTLVKKAGFEVQHSFYTKNGEQVPFTKGKNLVLIAKKTV